MDFWKIFGKALRKENFKDCFEKALKILFGTDNPEVWMNKSAPELASLITHVWHTHPELKSMDAVATDSDVADLLKIAKKINVKIQTAKNHTQKTESTNNLKKEKQSETYDPENISKEKQTEPDQFDDSSDNPFWTKLRAESIESEIPEGFIDFLYELYSKLSPENFISTIKDLSKDENEPLKKMLLSRQSEVQQELLDDLSKAMSKLHDATLESIRNIR